MVNKVILIGNLGKDPELRSTNTGQSVAGFSIAVNEQWTGKDGQKHDKTEWVNIVAWGKLGQLAAQYLAKGRKVYVEGKLQTRKWQDKNGADRYTTEVVAGQIVFLGGNPESREHRTDSDSEWGGRPEVGFPEDDNPFDPSR